MALYDRQYILNEFPEYDYNNPVHPWEININRQNGARFCVWQMQAFHYYWALKQCRDSGLVGVAIEVPAIPYCLNVYDPGVVGETPLVIASRHVQSIECVHPSSPTCNGAEVAQKINGYLPYLTGDGVIVGVIMDERYSVQKGRSPGSRATHHWNPDRFYNAILQPLIGENYLLLEEFDTFKNGIGFNFVLRKKQIGQP